MTHFEGDIYYSSYYAKGSKYFTSKICSECGIHLHNSYRGKIPLCKNCKKDLLKRDNEPSACYIYMFLKKLQQYEPSIYDMIKIMEIPMFKFKLKCHKILPDDIYKQIKICRVGKYCRFHIDFKSRFNTFVYNYIIKNKDRLKNNFDFIFDIDKSLEVIPYSIPLVYIPYMCFRYKRTDKTNDDNTISSVVEEEFIIDMLYYELCLLRKVINKEFNIYFNPQKGDLQCLTKHK